LLEVLPDYEVMGIFQIGAQPAEVTLLRKADGVRWKVKAGKTVDELKVEKATTIGKETFVEVSKGERRFLLAMKRPDDSPFLQGPLYDSWSNGLITEAGALTPRGKSAIANHLRQVVSAGQQYMLEEGANQAGYPEIVGTYFPDIVPVAGENYTGLVVTGGGRVSSGRALMVQTVFGEEVVYEY